MLNDYGTLRVNDESALFLANRLYNRVLRGRMLRGWQRLLGRPADDDCADTMLSAAGHEGRGGARYAGVQQVPIGHIVGSESRCGDFDADFAPLKENNRQRWVGIAAARMRGQTLPPVELIQVGDAYYVRDGHHRISVARAFGEEFIDAVVTVWG